MISLDGARELAGQVTGRDIAAHGWEDADAYLVLRATRGQARAGR